MISPHLEMVPDLHIAPCRKDFFCRAGNTGCTPPVTTTFRPITEGAFKLSPSLSPPSTPSRIEPVVTKLKDRNPQMSSLPFLTLFISSNKSTEISFSSYLPYQYLLKLCLSFIEVHEDEEDGMEERDRHTVRTHLENASEEETSFSSRTLVIRVLQCLNFRLKATSLWFLLNKWRC